MPRPASDEESVQPLLVLELVEPLLVLQQELQLAPSPAAASAHQLLPLVPGVVAAALPLVAPRGQRLVPVVFLFLETLFFAVQSAVELELTPSSARVLARLFRQQPLRDLPLR
jgi:hypothetical protein